MNQKRYGEQGQDLMQFGIPTVFPGPDPSLTPEQRYDWARDRLIEAYRCPETQPAQRRALLISIVENPVEDVQLMGAVYAALSNVELMGGSSPYWGNQSKEAELHARGSKAETYARKALELNPANRVAPFCLFQAIVIQDRPFDTFEAIAQYNIDLEIEETPRSEFYAPAQFTAAMMGKPLWLSLVDLSFLKNACDSPDGFERCFELHLRYPKSFHYTRRLLQAAMLYPNIPTSLISVLCHNFARSISAETVGMARYFVYLTVLLHNFLYLDDKPMVEKYLKETDELYPVYRETASQEELWDYWCHRLVALNHLGRYEEAAAMASDIDISGGFMDNAMLVNLMYSCVHLGRFDQAVQYGRAAVSLEGAHDLDFMYLGRAYLGSKDYAKAVEALKTAIWYVRNRTGRDSYQVKDRVITQVSFTKKESDYTETFKMLIQAYVGMEQYVEAEAAYRELSELVPDSHELSELRLMLTAQRDLIEKSGQVEKQCLRLKKELSASRNTLDEHIQRMKKWSDKLVKCQLLTDREVTDELWETFVRDKMDKVLDIVCETEMASSGKFYERKLREVKKRFPKLAKPLQSYFATAEQLYTSFKGNTAIDFAPVLVEYCKVVEGALWEYFAQSKDYKARCSQLLEAPKGQRTLGSACAIVSSEWDKPLYIFERDLQKLRKLRNDSAHVGVDRIPDVEWVRTYLWQGDLLDELVQVGV